MHKNEAKNTGVIGHFVFEKDRNKSVLNKLALASYVVFPVNTRFTNALLAPIFASNFVNRYSRKNDKRKLNY